MAWPVRPLSLACICSDSLMEDVGWVWRWGGGTGPADTSSYPSLLPLCLSLSHDRPTTPGSPFAMMEVRPSPLPYPLTLLKN